MRSLQTDFFGTYRFSPRVKSGPVTMPARTLVCLTNHPVTGFYTNCARAARAVALFGGICRFLMRDGILTRACIGCHDAAEMAPEELAPTLR